MEERLQKILAKAGLGSRRKCELLISEGRVDVNGKMAKVGMKADPEKDNIRVDQQEIPKMESKTYIAVYKPRLMLSDREPLNDDRPTIHHIVPNSEHLFSVGRLDFESEGLILLTNDGDLKNKLTHPRYGHTKEYRVLVASRPSEEQLETFQRGVVLEDGFRTRPAKVFVETIKGKGAWRRVELKEGHKRQIRETCKTIGLPVVRLVRVSIGPLKLGRMKPKDWRVLTEREVAMLKGDAPKGEVSQSPYKLKPGRRSFGNNKPYTSKAGSGSKSGSSSRSGSSRSSSRSGSGTGSSSRSSSSSNSRSGSRSDTRSGSSSRPGSGAKKTNRH